MCIRDRLGTAAHPDNPPAIRLLRRLTVLPGRADFGKRWAEQKQPPAMTVATTALAMNVRRPIPHNQAEGCQANPLFMDWERPFQMVYHTGA